MLATFSSKHSRIGLVSILPSVCLSVCLSCQLIAGKWLQLLIISAGNREQQWLAYYIAIWGRRNNIKLLYDAVFSHQEDTEESPSRCRWLISYLVNVIIWCFAGLRSQAYFISVDVYVWLHSAWSSVHCKCVLSAFHTPVWCAGMCGLSLDFQPFELHLISLPPIQIKWLMIQKWHWGKIIEAF